MFWGSAQWSQIDNHTIMDWRDENFVNNKQTIIGKSWYDLLKYRIVNNVLSNLYYTVL